MSESSRHDSTQPPPAPAPPPVGWHTTARQVHGGIGLSVEASFHYDPDDPWAVRITFRPPLGDCVVWTFSRELLRSGTRVLSGEGDVRLWPLRRGGRDGRVRIRLGPAGAFAVVDVDRAGLRSWLGATYAAVPEGGEAARIDWAAETPQLFSRP
ncbi:SsgA family sporulation/cell division regulator [Streptomyces sp. Je 1-79]|uniref:SsgA family sporulation/cell division regulator n=1 Tax=Streptomyces sp. Je 1-79 TaxID=2943847 RepID=UPI0021A2639A|nr:SsgA family sporulation/cell division regulator [Streptomyces sp. Je 1-79]MCT4351867.1 SsgA family sporulation/cell division regulator [Streptomyces sp. Je 1-79]